MALTDRASLDRVQSVYESDRARLWRSLVAYTGSKDLADDAMAEAFAQAIRRGAEIRDVQAWVWRSAFKIARGELKRRRHANAELPELRTEDHADELSRLLAELGELSHSDRELLVLCHVAGWRPAELSRVTGVPPGVLRVRLHRATRRARDLLVAGGA